MAEKEQTVYRKLDGAKPCPCCGGRDIMIRSDYYGHLHTVYCHNIAECGLTQSGFAVEEKAIEAWNRRA